VNPNNSAQGPCRVMLVYDRQPNGAFPAIADILYNAPAGAVEYGSGINMTNKSRFSVLRDLRIQVDPTNGDSFVFHTYSKCNAESEFGADGGTIGDIRTGALYLVAFTGILTGANVISIRNCMTRIRYFD
jgi:hypothetical protein